MYANTSLSKPDAGMQSAQHQRVKGNAAVSFKFANGKTRLDKLYQHGSAKIRFPKTYQKFAEAVLINTAGGLTGGDSLDWSLKLEAETNTVFTTQACEKSYKSSESTAQVSTQIIVGENATCHWLPQETILYDCSSLARTLDIQLASSSRLIAFESVMLGREAMGENIDQCFFKDKWRIKRDDKLIFADDVKLEGNAKEIEKSQTLMAGQKAFSTLVYSGPEDDEQLQLIANKLRKIMQGKYMASSAFNGKIVARFLSCDTYKMRAELIPVLKELSGNELPRVWRI